MRNRAPTWSCSASLNPGRARTGCTWTFASPPLEPELARLLALGAEVVTPEPIDEDGFCWVVLADPEGNEFCVGTEPLSDT
jgi:predicted enzyme related to lactoylglutathione lyase